MRALIICLAAFVFTISISTLTEAGKSENYYGYEQLAAKAKSGDVQAQIELGKAYYWGKVGGTQNNHKSFRWFKKAVATGAPEAILRLGFCYWNGVGTKVDKAKALELIREAANKENAEAHFNLGKVFQKGLLGEEVSVKDAITHFQKSSDLGYSHAANELGRIYISGNGVEKDEKRAVEYYTKAADNGSQYALFNLGDCYADGVGVKVDHLKALEYYKKAADKGLTRAYNRIHGAYRNGRGVKKNIPESIKWITKSANSGNYDAIIYLVRAHLFGWEGYEKSVQKAGEWAELGGRNEYSHPYAEIGEIFYSGTKPYKKNYIEAVKWLKKAAAFGNHVDAVFILGNIYFHGEGLVKANLLEAKKWYKECDKISRFDGCKRRLKTLDGLWAGKEDEFERSAYFKYLVNELGSDHFSYRKSFSNKIGKLEISPSGIVHLNGEQIVDITIHKSVSQTLDRLIRESKLKIYMPMNTPCVLWWAKEYERQHLLFYGGPGILELTVVNTFNQLAIQGRYKELQKILSYYVATLKES